MENLKKQILKFRNDRDWKQFHTPENLAKSISLEAAEILEHFQWNNNYDLHSLSEEVADVFIYIVLMADSLGVDLESIVKNKLEVNEKKYPVEKAFGNSKKHTENMRDL